MRIFGTGDDHIDEASARWDECRRLHDWFAELVERERPDAVLDGGDIYERASTAGERDYASNWCRRIAEVCPMVIAKGNHDRDKDCAILGKLRAKHPIVVEEGAGVHVLHTAAGPLAVAAMAWPQRNRLLSMVESSEEADNVGQQLIQNVLRGLGDQLAAHNCPRVLLGHFMVDGSEVGAGQPPLIGQPMRVALADLALVRADIVLMSHIHQAQSWNYEGTPIVYCGSSFAQKWGEVDPKGIVEVEIDGHDALWNRIPTPRTPMVMLEGAWTGDAFDGPGKSSVADAEAGAEVRFRYTVDPDLRSAAATAAGAFADELCELGAVNVKVEEVVNPQVRARAPEVAQAKGIRAKLNAMWDARGDELSAERRERIGTMAEEL